MNPEDLILALDFDGTCVEHRNPPEIGPEIGAAPYLKVLSDSGVRIILWTMRSEGYIGLNNPIEAHDALGPALAWFHQHRIKLWGVNQNRDQLWTKSAKVHAHMILDDTAFGCPLVKPEGKRAYVDWSVTGPGLLVWAGLSEINLADKSGSDESLISEG